uniref:PPM-type phosphatase domain-containing protein n=1 Tax=Arcella intermedia TaxID=1963864 RepID=A0A6B2L099_9EUKA
MEDAITMVGGLKTANVDYFGVFDGHSGDSASKFASKKLHTFIEKRLTSKESDIPTLLKLAFKDCQEAMKEAKVDAGTTVVIALIVGNELYIANCGDSRAVLVQGLQAHTITVDHKPSNESERKRIEAIPGGYVHNGRVIGKLAVSRSLGDFSSNPYVSFEPDIFGPFLWNDYSMLILACDGVWDVTSDKEAARIASKGVDPQDSAMKIREDAYKKSTKDNISVVIVWFPMHNVAISEESTSESEESSETSEEEESESEEDVASPRGPAKEGLPVALPKQPSTQQPPGVPRLVMSPRPNQPPTPRHRNSLPKPIKPNNSSGQTTPRQGAPASPRQMLQAKPYTPRQAGPPTPRQNAPPTPRQNAPPTPRQNAPPTPRGVPIQNSPPSPRQANNSPRQMKQSSRNTLPPQKHIPTLTPRSANPPETQPNIDPPGLSWAQIVTKNSPRGTNTPPNPQTAVSKSPRGSDQILNPSRMTTSQRNLKVENPRQQQEIPVLPSQKASSSRIGNSSNSAPKRTQSWTLSPNEIPQWKHEQLKREEKWHEREEKEKSKKALEIQKIAARASKSGNPSVSAKNLASNIQ